MKATPVIGSSAPIRAWSNSSQRNSACATKPPTQPRISGIFPVSFALSIVPSARMASGTSQSTVPLKKFVKW